MSTHTTARNETTRDRTRLRTTLLLLATYGTILFTACVLVSDAHAAYPVTTNGYPTVNASFDESIYVKDASLNRSQGSLNITVTNASGTLLFRSPSAVQNQPLASLLLINPLSSLTNTIHTVALNASDWAGNSGLFIYGFVVNAPGQTITLLEPANGGTTSKATDLVVRTQYPSDCRYSKSGAPIRTRAIYNGMTPMVPDQNTNYREHRINGFYTAMNINPLPNEVVAVSVTCDDSNGNLTGVVFSIVYLQQEPTLTVTHVPEPIVDPLNASATVSIASDQQVWCMASTSIRDEPVLGPESDATFVYNQTYVFYDETVGWTYSNLTVTFDCKNRADLHTIWTEVIGIDYFREISVNVTSPLFTNRKTGYTLKFASTKTAACTATLNGTDTPVNPRTPSQGTLFQSASSLSLVEGVNQLVISCQADGMAQPKDFAFDLVVDSVAPKLNNITAPSPSCSLSELSFTLNAADPAPGRLAAYNYTIRAQNNQTPLIPWTSAANPDVVVKNLKLQNGTVYSIGGLVVDAAGNPSNAPSSPVTVQVTASGPDEPVCDKEEPDTYLVKKKAADNKSVNVSVYCRDNVICDDVYYLNSVPVPANANVNNITCTIPTGASPRHLNDTFVFTQTTKVCWNVSDIANPKHYVAKTDVVYLLQNGSEPPTNGTCTDKAKNQDETDIDCGGLACIQSAKCALNATCKANFDCASRYCALGSFKCAVPSCTDGVQNGNETGKDCGGTCSACTGAGTTCTSNADCTSPNVCTAGRCGPKPPPLPPDGCADPDGCEPTTETPGSFGLINIILLALGILLVIGGGSYIMLYKEPRKELPSDPYQRDTSATFEQPLTLPPRGGADDGTEQQGGGQGRSALGKRLRERKRERVRRAIAGFETPEELKELEDISHEHIEQAYQTFDAETFKETTKALLENEQVDKRDVAVALSDIAARQGEGEHEAITDLRKEFGITDSDLPPGDLETKIESTEADATAGHTDFEDAEHAKEMAEAIRAEQLVEEREAEEEAARAAAAQDADGDGRAEAEGDAAGRSEQEDAEQDATSTSSATSTQRKKRSAKPKQGKAATKPAKKAAKRGRQ